MKIYTSYFYQIRFFSIWEVPFSTAVWDPKWYHNYKDQSYNFMDKHGVLNGLRIKDFRPGIECENLCRGSESCLTKDPSTCEFLQTYERQLQALDAASIENYFNMVLDKLSKKLHLPMHFVPVLIVHEAPTNPCSERVIIQKVLREKGFECEEWHQP